MEIVKIREDKKLEVQLSGRLDTTTAPQLEAAMAEELDETAELVMDFDGLAYISSAGLRVLLSLQKTMNRQGSMVIKNVCPEIMEVFEITGFSDILTIQR